MNSVIKHKLTIELDNNDINTITNMIDFMDRFCCEFNSFNCGCEDCIFETLCCKKDVFHAMISDKAYTTTTYEEL